MAKDKNVISLDERRRGAKRGGARRPDGQGDPTSTPSPQDAAKPADSPAFATGATDAGQAPGATDDRPLPGRLVWLYCPTCRTLEYTEVELPGGRMHNTCGTAVQEATMELDLRAETTLARVNLERLSLLESVLAGQRERYEEYLRRLELAAGRRLQPYANTEPGAGRLPVAAVDALGLLVSRFFHDPAALFPELAAERAADEQNAAPTATPEPTEPEREP